MWENKRMKKLLLLILIFATSLHAEIILPPDPGRENDKTLMGIDSNKNNVRDDLEIFVYNEITKDEKLFKAYLNYIESEILMMMNIDDIQNLKKLLQQKASDLSCISSLQLMEAGTSTKINKKIYNTTDRKKIRDKLNNGHNRYSTPIKLIDKDKRFLQCR